MGVLLRSWLGSGLLLSLLAQQALSVVVFRDVEPPQLTPKRLMVRGTQNHNESYYYGLDPQRQDSFYWSGNDNGRETMANFTVDTAEDKTSIVSIEKFSKMLKSVHCTNSSLTMGFKDHASFAYMRRKWQWVNDDDNRKFIMVAGTGNCGWNQHRLPFNVSEIVFDDRANAARLHGVPTEWKKAIQNYELTVGYMPGSRSGSRKRDLDKSLSVDFNHPLPLSSMEFNTPVDDLKVTYSCESCGTKGSFDLGFHIKTEWGIPKEASFSLAPNDVSASFTPSLGISGNFTDQFGDELPLGSIPIGGFSIPGGVLEIGPEIEFSLGYTLGPVSGSATVSTGVTVSLSKSAELEIALTSPDVSASGWTPQVETEPLKLEAKIEATMEVFVKAAVQLSAEALGQGFEAGIDLKPYYGATMGVSSSSEGACEDDNEKHALGVSVQPKAGVSLNAEVAKADDPADPIASVEIAAITADMDSACYGFGPSGAASSSASATPSSSKAASSHSVTLTPTPSPSEYTSSSAYPTSTPYSTNISALSSATSTSATPSSSSLTPSSHLHRRNHRRHGWH
ncbi:hypothetical protein FE257_010293 [Aspergillus nanangensis]|uniref:Uncharacterized protein n=1 Tax=Aspergillus nanangensis TaxID=2582783 RepID=A0AAD4CK87_ASPNN|nr:hypothetical protein FE257_010293 [Aspergillus nanangensis]